MFRLIRATICNAMFAGLLWLAHELVNWLNMTGGWLHAVLVEISAWCTLFGTLAVAGAIVALPILVLVLLASGGLKNHTVG